MQFITYLLHNFSLFLSSFANAIVVCKGEKAVMEDEKRERQLRELGLTISYYRKLKGLTQAQLAGIIGLSRTHISNIEAPKIKTSLSAGQLI